MPMHVSHNEILLTCRKALDSLGWAQGDWEDGAAAVAWLELHGLGGIDRFFNAFPRLNTPYSRPLEIRSHTELDANGSSCLLVGAWALDRAYVDAKSTDGRSARINLHNCHDPFFLIAYMLRCAQRGLQISASWRSDDSPDDGWIVHCPANALYPSISSYRHLHGDVLPQSSVRFALTEHLSFPFFSASPDNVYSWRGQAEFAAAAAKNLQNGIAVNDKQWQMLKELAKGILVPESAESRARGAGE